MRTLAARASTAASPSPWARTRARRAITAARTCWKCRSMVEKGGFSPAEAIYAATVNAARLMRLDQDLGTLGSRQARRYHRDAEEPARRHPRASRCQLRDERRPRRPRYARIVLPVILGRAKREPRTQRTPCLPPLGSRPRCARPRMDREVSDVPEYQAHLPRPRREPHAACGRGSWGPSVGGLNNAWDVAEQAARAAEHGGDGTDRRASIRRSRFRRTARSCACAPTPTSRTSIRPSARRRRKTTSCATSSSASSPRSPATNGAGSSTAPPSINQVDDTHIEFTLRDGLIWTDGYGPVTADDVKFSYERIADPEDGIALCGRLGGARPCRGDRREVRRDRPEGGRSRRSGTRPCSSAPARSSAARRWRRRAASSRRSRRRNAAAISSRSGSRSSAPCSSRNPDWPGDAPDLDEIHIIPIEDEKMAELAFEGGDLDYTWVAVSSIPRYRETPPEGRQGRGKAVARLCLARHEHGGARPSTIADVRRAVQHAIDVPAVLDAAYFGAAEAATGIIAPGLIGHREKVLYGYDPDKARELLKKAGMERLRRARSTLLNKSTNVCDRAGDPGASSPRSASTSPSTSTIPARSGRSATRRPATAGRRIQLMLDRFSMQPDPSFATEWFTPDQIGVWNWERWNSPEFDELEAKAKVELDSAEAPRDVRAHAGSDGGRRLLRLPHPRGGRRRASRHDRARRSCRTARRSSTSSRVPEGDRSPAGAKRIRASGSPALRCAHAGYEGGLTCSPMR